ncbi:MAG TPA: SBBP repeat-containing protein, partial [Burkholderiaceae bacterium]|nr:SBBP repeat-containing protein [Burkholderiaceae bacterium]
MNRAVGLRLQERWYWIVAAAMAGLSMLGSPPSKAAGQPPVAATADFQRSQVLAFEPNRGQTDKRVQFIARSAGYTVFLTGTQAVLAPRGQRGAQIRQEAPVQMKLVGANPSPKVTALDELPGKVNYVGSSTSQQRVVNVPTYSSVRYAAVYPGIDLVYYGNRGRLEYDFVVSPEANPEVITLAFEGAQTIEIDDDGALVLRTADGEIRQPAPIVHQELHREREPISSRWVRVGPQRVGVRVGPYDRTRPLVIDPLVLYSSYLGGSGDDAGGAIALDAGGNIYVAGATSSPDFPGAPA